jgi:undecaprenyl phosphate-alpha-L-ara4N flippase subunit ArnF
MSVRRGVSLALASVALVSAAQLGMRWSMTRLPLPQDWLANLAAARLDLAALAVLAAGVLGYALSLLCWMGALRHLPLGRAYALLSLSYVLVYLGSVLLPGFDGSLTLERSLGVLLVVLGVLTINSPRRPQTASHSRR